MVFCAVVGRKFVLMTACSLIVAHDGVLFSFHCRYRNEANAAITNI
jgi:hypothetical protein